MNVLPQLDFGLLVAYFFPGFVAVYGIRYLSPRVFRLLEATWQAEQSLGLIFVVVVSGMIAGVIVSSVRSVLLDPLHDWTGAQLGPLNYSALGNNVELVKSFQEAVSNTYRFYQFNGNMVIALGFLAAARAHHLDWSNANGLALHVLNWIAIALLFVHSRHSRRKTHRVLTAILRGAPTHGKKEG